MSDPAEPSAAAYEAARVLVAGVVKGDPVSIEHVARLPLDVWHTPQQREVARCVNQLRERDEPVEAPAILRLAKSEVLEPWDLSTMSVPPTSARPDLLADEILRNWRRRQRYCELIRITTQYPGLSDDEISDRLDQANGVVGSNLGGSVIRFSEVQPEQVEWLWLGRLARGKLTILDGDPGLGKSTLTVEIAAKVSSGRLLYGEHAVGREPAGVVLINAEDGLADTILPRLKAAGADLHRVAAMTEIRNVDGTVTSLTLPDDLPRVRRAIREVGAKLVILDPLMAFLSSRTDSHRDQDVRKVLGSLKLLAEDTGTALLLVRHLNKTAGANPIYRGGGSIAFVGAARTAFLIGRDPHDPEKRVLACNKSNLGPEPPSLGLQIVHDDDTGVSRINWIGEAQVTAAELVGMGPPRGSKLRDAEDFLATYLADGPRKQTEILSEATRRGIASKTLRRARETLGVKPRKAGVPGAEQFWTWELPEDAHGWAEGAQESGRASSGGNGHLRDGALTKGT
ncbi:MAG: AAA family ATPase [Candidatus Hydrogenedentes bacterium]|nr:AAA family ATPase [Candidatus Hydrogenedentota bacterium]